MSGETPSKGRLYFLLALMLLFWSANFVIGKVALREFPALLLVGLRTTMAAIFILPIYLWRQRRQREAWKTTEFVRVLMLGLFGVVLNQLLFVVALARTSAIHAVLVVVLMPVLVLLFAAFLGQETITPRKALGMSTAAAGVALLQLSKDPGSGATLLGDFIMFLSVITFAIFTVKGKQMAKQHSSLTVTTIAYVGGALVLAPMTLWMSSHFDLTRVSAGAWWSLVYMAIFPAVIAYLIYYYALTYIAATRVSAVAYLQPLVASLLAIALLGEGITTALVIGGILVLTGVVVTERA